MGISTQPEVAGFEASGQIYGFTPFLTFFILGIVTEREEIKEGGFDILSFDGGGTKGVMEAFIMNDIMNISIWILCFKSWLKIQKVPI